MKELKFAFSAGLACFAALLLLQSTGCNNMPNGGIPIYVRIDSATVVVDASETRYGSASFRIPDVWGTVGNHDLGAYEMPVNIPVLAQGDVYMLVSAGIFDNGIVSSRVAYPFYRPDTFTIHNAIPGHVYHHKPVYHYFSSVQVALNETFENTNVSAFSHLTVVNKPAQDYDSLVYEGLRSGVLTMAVNDSIDTIMQTVPVTVNTNGREAYIEMNYKSSLNSNIYLDVVLRATQYDLAGNITAQNDFPEIRLAPKGYWNKTYVNISTEAGYNQGAKFQIIFIAYRLPGTVDNFYFDNVKFLYLN